VSADRLRLLAHPAVASAFGRELGQHVEYREQLGSTQDRAKELAPGPAVVVTDLQTAGRGTSDRTWVADRGTSILASFVLPGPPAASAVASLVAGVGVARALEALGLPGARLKWPNDVLLRGRKVAGILTHLATGAGGHVIVGVGLNITQSDGELTGFRSPATSLAIEGLAVDRLVALEVLARAITAVFALPPEDALAEWRQRSNMLGHVVSVARAGAEPVRGLAAALDPDGALRVETAYGPQRILVGEVTVEDLSANEEGFARRESPTSPEQRGRGTEAAADAPSRSSRQ